MVGRAMWVVSLGLVALVGSAFGEKEDTRLSTRDERPDGGCRDGDVYLDLGPNEWALPELRGL